MSGEEPPFPARKTTEDIPPKPRTYWYLVDGSIVMLEEGMTVLPSWTLIRTGLEAVVFVLFRSAFSLVLVTAT
jgi:hypothetical protein